MKNILKPFTRAALTGFLLFTCAIAVAQLPGAERFIITGQQGFSPLCAYYIVQGNHLQRLPLTVVRRLNEYTAVAAVSDTATYGMLSRRVKIFQANNGWKYAPGMEARLQKMHPGRPAVFIVAGRSAAELQGLFAARTGHVRVLRINEAAASLVIECTPAYLTGSLMALPGLVFAAPHFEAASEAPVIGYNRSFNGINQLDFALANANGNGIVAGIKEDRMDAADLDLQKRVLPSTIAAPATDLHATAIASLLGGAGNSFYDGRGVAPGCRFFSSSFANLFADDATVLSQSQVSVQNHSYGTLPQQFYGPEALSYDAHTWQNKEFLHVFSAGNRGTAAATEGPYTGIAGFANITGNFKMAKNIITVGAVNDAGNIFTLSSAGPLYDGRLAPQLTALGPNGTSDAAAVVSGAIAVVQQVYKDSNNQALPPAALVKAVLFNTATDIHKPGIDYKTGYGMMNGYEAVKAVQDKKYESGLALPQQDWTKIMVLPSNTARFKITLAWTDTASAVNNFRALINDLDLEVKELGTGTVYRPWVLRTMPVADSLNLPPVRGRDSLNTAEQVVIDLPAAGAYQVTVKPYSISTAALPFHIAWSADTLNTFLFTSPQHTSDINRQENENLFIRWKAFVADTNTTGNLFISYNQGGAWQPVQSSVKIHTQQYRWPVKDTASVARFKMETPFGSFLSKEVIISPVTRTSVDYLCADSFQISWGKHIYATAYRVYALPDSAYMKLLFTVTDTFKSFQRALWPYKVFAVEPVLSNQLPAARSVAMNIEQQAVQCFYKALNYNLLDNNIVQLVLEMSFTGHADSVVFERVNAAGQVLQRYSGVMMQPGVLLYTKNADGLPPGITYFRAVIHLKSGAAVTTETIQVLTSGSRQLVFYPNPAPAGRPFNYVMRQGLPFDSRLDILDLYGRIVRQYESLPGTVNTNQWPAGIYIYRLMSSSGALLETGRLVTGR